MSNEEEMVVLTKAEYETLLAGAAAAKLKGVRVPLRLKISLRPSPTPMAIVMYSDGTVVDLPARRMDYDNILLIDFETTAHVR